MPAAARPLAVLPVLAALVLSTLVLLGSPARAAGQGLTAAQERVVLDLVDDACGDSWCEGDYAFSFRRLSCSSADGVCRLRLRIALLTDAPLRWRWRTGELRYRTYEQLVVPAPDGSLSLASDVYLELTGAVQQVEATMPAPS